MQLKLSKFYKRNNGSISIEFAIICPCLILMFAFVLELSRIMLIGSALDLEVAEVSRKTATTENANTTENYEKQFMEQLEKDIPWLGVLSSKDKFKVNVSKCTSIDDIIRDQCAPWGYGSDGKILLFNVEYKYSTALFPSLFGNFINTTLNKKAAVFREYINCGCS